MSRYKLKLDKGYPVIEGLAENEVATSVNLSFKNYSSTEAAENTPGPGIVTFILKSPGQRARKIRFPYSL